MAQWTSELHGQSDALPTVNQWIKTVSRECAEATRIVKLIWCPNMYQNYSLDTEAFRLRVPEKHFLFQVLQDNLEDWINSDVVLALEIEKLKIPKVTLITLENEQCDWDPLGEYGWKSGQVTAKAKNVASKTRSKQDATKSHPPHSALEALSEG